MWATLDLLTWVLAPLIKNINYLFLFLIWQSLSSIFILYNYLVFKNIYTMCLLLIFKRGLPPFQLIFWFFQSFWSINSFLLFLFAHKYPVLLILIVLRNLDFIMWLALRSLLILILFRFNFSLKRFIFTYTISETIWIILSFSCNIRIWILYLIINTMFLIILWKIIEFKIMFKTIYVNFFLIFILFIFIRLPPFITFILKWQIMTYTSFLLIILIMTISFLLLIIIWFFMYFLRIFYGSLLSINFLLLYSYILVNSTWSYLI